MSGEGGGLGDSGLGLWGQMDPQPSPEPWGPHGLASRIRGDMVDLVGCGGTWRTLWDVLHQEGDQWTLWDVLHQEGDRWTLWNELHQEGVGPAVLG